MRKYYKLIDSEWVEITKVLIGQTETEVIDDTLDNGVIIYDSLSNSLIPVFTPIMIDNLSQSVLTITDEVYLSYSGGNYYVSESWGWSSQLNDVEAGDLIELTNQTNPEENRIYQVVNYSGGILELKRYNKYSFFLAAEERMTTRTKVEPYKYRHTLIYIEPTKYLEKIIVNNLCLTNKSDTLKQQIEKALINCELIEVDQNPRFSLSSELIDFLGNTPGEDFFFDKATLREILDAMLAVKNARVYIEKITDFDNIVISYIDMNATGETVEFEKMVNIERRNDGEMHHGQILVTGANAAINKPISHGWSALKTTEATLTSSNATVATEFPIERITYFKILCDAVVKTGPTYDELTTNVEEVDITDYVYDLEAFKTLPTSGDNDPHQQNSIYYTRGSNLINTETQSKLLFFTVTNIQNAAESALKKIYGSAARITFGRNFLDFLIYLVYYPYIEANGTVYKLNLEKENISRLTIPDTQSEKLINVERYGQNLLGKSTRLGNDLYEIDDVVKNTDELKKVGQKTSDNYVIYKREVSYFNDYAKVRYSLSKNYNNLNEKIGINREKRIYDIPLTGYVNELVIKEFILLTILNEHQGQPINTGSLSEDGVALLIGAHAISNSINNYILLETTTADGVKGPFELNAATYILGNAIHFVGKCYDNYSIGPSIGSQIIGGGKVLYNPYVDTKGEFTKFKVRLVRTKDAVYQKDTAKAKLLPRTEYSYYDNVLIEPVEYNYKKDAFQHIGINYQIEIRPVIGQDKGIIIGRKFLERNGLTDTGIQTFKTSGDLAIKIYASTELYGAFENIKAKGTVQPGMSLDIGTNSISITGSVSLSNAKSLAIADNDGNLYFAINIVHPTFRTITFIPSKTIQ